MIAHLPLPKAELVDDWTFTLKDPDGRLQVMREWVNFSALVASKPDQVTTDGALATEARARLKRVAG